MSVANANMDSVKKAAEDGKVGSYTISEFNGAVRTFLSLGALIASALALFAML